MTSQAILDNIVTDCTVERLQNELYLVFNSVNIKIFPAAHYFYTSVILWKNVRFSLFCFSDYYIVYRRNTVNVKKKYIFLK